MLPQPGLQAEEIDVEISWFRDLASGGSLAGVFIRAATGVVETPAHQAHLEEGENGMGVCHSPSSKPQPPWFLQRPPSSPAQGQDPITPVLRAFPFSPHLKKPESPLKENCSSRFSCRKKGQDIVILTLALLPCHWDRSRHAC